MAIVSLTILKSYFQKGDKPTESQFVDLIDTLASLPEPSDNGLIQTIAKDDFDELIANEDLVIGQQYIVVGAYESNVFNGQNWDILCTASSVNSVDSKAWIVNAGNLYVPCDYDPITPTVLIGSIYGVFVSPETANDWGSISPNEIIVNSQIIINGGGGGQYYLVTVSSDPAVLILKNVLDLSSGLLGEYNPSSDTFYPNADLYSPTITPDGSVISAIASVIASYTRVDDFADCVIKVRCDADFSVSNIGSIEFTYPFATSNGETIGTAALYDEGVVPSTPILLDIVDSGSGTGVINLICNDSSYVSSPKISINFKIKIQ